MKLQRTSKLRKTTFEMIKHKIKEVYAEQSAALAQQVKVEMYGSMATGLAIDCSDLDLLVHNFVPKDSPLYGSMTRLDTVNELQKLHAALGDVFGVVSNTLIDTASVPVIKIRIDLVELCKREKEKNGRFPVDPAILQQDEETQELNVDITLDEPRAHPSQEHLGLQCCKYVKRSVAEYPRLKILALVFKKFLQLKGLNKPFSGGLSSYSLVQMILALMKDEDAAMSLLRVQDGQQMSNARVKSLSVGMIFKHFLHHYGFAFDTMGQGIDQDGTVTSRDTFDYLLHAPTCNINAGPRP
jgi:DNA polymerase sigma